MIYEISFKSTRNGYYWSFLICFEFLERNEIKGQKTTDKLNFILFVPNQPIFWRGDGKWNVFVVENKRVNHCRFKVWSNISKSSIQIQIFVVVFLLAEFSFHSEIREYFKVEYMLSSEKWYFDIFIRIL